MTSSTVPRRFLQRCALALGALVVTLVTAVASAPPAAAMYIDDTPGPHRDGWCAPGHACVYRCLVVVGDHCREHRYYYYGSYNFVDEYGDHTVWNNQTRGARVQLCLGYGGTNCTVTIPAGRSFHGNLTPYNSIKLIP